MLGYYGVDPDFSVRCRRGNHVGACLNHVGNDGIRAAVQLLDAADLDDRRARSRDVCTAGVEKVCKVNDVRLLGGVVKHRGALCKHRCKHQIDRSADRRDVKVDGVAREPLRSLDVDVSVFGRYLGTECFKALDVLIERTVPEITSSGPADGRFSKSSELGTEQIRRAAKLLYKLVGRGALLDVGGIYGDGRGRFVMNEHSHLL